MNKEKALLLVFGEGGHSSQMQRLLQHISIPYNQSGVQIIAINDSELCSLLENTSQVVLPPLRGKYQRFSLKRFVGSLCLSISAVFALAKQYDVRLVLSTGPGHAILPAIIFRLLGKKIIHIETWSRFYTASYSGKILYKLSNVFYVQNKEQLALYPKAIWSGRL